jgi:hypothetical protein
MMGEVFVRPKEKTIVRLLVVNPLWFHLFAQYFWSDDIVL